VAARKAADAMVVDTLVEVTLHGMFFEHFCQ
jgi:hypothetical protein